VCLQARGSAPTRKNAPSPRTPCVTLVMAMMAIRGHLTFDDPSVADEAIVPNFSTLNHPVEGGNAVDNRFDWSFTRLLTPVLQVQVDSGWIHRNWPTARTSGFATTDVGIKSEIYRHNQHEMLGSAGLLWGIGHSGAQAVGADEPNSILPGVFFGKGFGDLPDGLAWLRPFAITGAFVDELPFGVTTTALGFGAPNGKAHSVLVPTVETLHWGFSLQYSTLDDLIPKLFDKPLLSDKPDRSLIAWH